MADHRIRRRARRGNSEPPLLGASSLEELGRSLDLITAGFIRDPKHIGRDATAFLQQPTCDHVGCGALANHAVPASIAAPI
jgi:hypothetical protein